MFLIIKNFGAGIFSLLDFIVAFFISFFSYLYWGIKNILFFLWKWGFEFVFKEIFNMLKALAEGIKYIFIILFRDIPVLIYTKISKYVYEFYLKIKRLNNNIIAIKSSARI